MCLAIPGKILEIEIPEDSVFTVGKISFSGITKLADYAIHFKVGFDRILFSTINSVVTLSRSN